VQETGEAFHVLVRDYARHHHPADRSIIAAALWIDASRRIDLPIVGSRFNA
jgi:hypothetical protein